MQIALLLCELLSGAYEQLLGKSCLSEDGLADYLWKLANRQDWLFIRLVATSAIGETEKIEVRQASSGDAEEQSAEEQVDGYR